MHVSRFINLRQSAGLQVDCVVRCFCWHLVNSILSLITSIFCGISVFLFASTLICAIRNLSCMLNGILPLQFISKLHVHIFGFNSYFTVFSSFFGIKVLTLCNFYSSSDDCYICFFTSVFLSVSHNIICWM